MGNMNRCPKCKKIFWTAGMKLEKRFYASFLPKRVFFCPVCKVELFQNSASKVLFRLLFIPAFGIWVLPSVVGGQVYQETYKSPLLLIIALIALAYLIFGRYEVGKREIDEYD